MMGRRSAGSAAATAVVVAMLAAFGLSIGEARASTHDDAPPVSLQLTTYGPDLLQPGRTFTITGTVDNPSLAPVDGLDLVLEVTTSHLVDRSSLAHWEAGDLDVATREVARASVGQGAGVPANGSASALLFASPESLGFAPGSTAVAGVQVRLEYRGETLSVVKSFATWFDAEATVTPVSVVVVASGSVERVDALVTAANLPAVTFAVDPTVLSRSTRGDLSLPDAYLLPAHGIDVPSLARAGGFDLLDRALTDARAAGTLPESAPWMAVATDIDRATEELASSRGAKVVLSLPALAVEPVELSGYAGTTPPGFALSSDGLPGRPLLVYPDPFLSAALSSALPGSRTSGARIIAETALLGSENTAGNPIVVVVGPSWSVDAVGTSDTLGALFRSPWVQPVPFGEAMLTVEPAVAVLQPSVASPSDVPADLVATAGSAYRGITALADATADPQGFSSALVDGLLRMLEMDRRADPAARDEQLVATLEGIAEVREGVGVPEGSTLNLISNTGNIPVTITNDLDVEVTVVVVLESRTAILRVDDRPQVVVAPGTAAQVLIPVTAISSGNAAVRLSLTNLNGERLTPVTDVKIRIHAQWGTMVTVALGAVVALLLLVGTIRTARRGRAETRRFPPSDPIEDAG